MNSDSNPVARRSPHARLHPVPIGAVTMGNGFWQPRLEANRAGGMLAFLTWLDRDDQTAPFRAYAKYDGSDSDEPIRAALKVLDDNFHQRNVHRLRHDWRGNFLAWMEACAWTLQGKEDDALRDTFEQFARGIARAHQSRAFLDTYYGRDYEFSYQLATPGHFIQMAIAHHRTTGSDALLDCATALADDLCRKFKGEQYAEHPCIEMALVELFRTTGDAAYLTAARHFIEPLRQQPAAIGPDFGEGDWRHFNRHVVRQTYLCAGAADYVAETADAEIAARLDAVWNDMTRGKLLLSGQLAIDPICPEHVTRDAYQLSVGVFGTLHGTTGVGCELCEAVGNLFWNWRMLALRGEARYADQFERTLYNGFLAHVSSDGERFFNYCPLASDGGHPPRTVFGGHSEVSCCPPNALRMLAALPGFFFSTSAHGLWIHLYDNCQLHWRLEDGTGIDVIQKTNYPWDGRIAIELLPERATVFDLHLRIPSWCRQARVQVNGAAVDVPCEGGSYVRIRRTWTGGDAVSLELSMPVARMAANPRVVDYRDKMALMRGPLVYCFEAVDHPDRPVWDIELRGEANTLDRDWEMTGQLYDQIGEATEFEPAFRREMLRGLTTLRGPDAERSTALTAIPYYAWANRTPGAMRVWVGRRG